MAIAIKVEGEPVDPALFTGIGLPEPLLEHDGNGHHEEPLEETVIFARKPGGNGNNHQGNLGFSPECPHCSHCPSYNHEDPNCIPHTPGVDPLELQLDRRNCDPRPSLTPQQKNRMIKLE